MSDLSRGRALLDVRRYAEARDALARHLAAEPDDAEAWALLAVAQHGNAAYAEMRDAAQRAAALAPEDEWPHRLRSVAASGLGRVEEAIDAADEAVRADPMAWPAWVRLAEALAEEPARRRDAWQAACHAVGLAPDVAATHATVGTVASALGWQVEAEAAFRQALAIDPHDAAALNNLSAARLRRDDVGGATAGFADALRADPTLDVARGNLDLAGRHLVTRALGVAFGGLWISALGLLLPFGVRLVVGVVLAGTYAVLVGGPVRGLPPTVRAHLRRAIRSDRGLAALAGCAAVGLVGTLLACLLPVPLPVAAGLVVAAVLAVVAGLGTAIWRAFP